MIPVTAAIALSEDEIEEHFICSSGPGGQHVNKIRTAGKDAASELQA